MRGNSGFLRWISHQQQIFPKEMSSIFSNTVSNCSYTTPKKPATMTRTSTILLTLVYLLAATASIHAGPVSQRHKRMIDTTDKNATSSQVERCLHNGLEVPKNSVECEQKVGCRALQKTGTCCPDYQCECERNGTIYANREKFLEPTNPCIACYCQGGDIVCNLVVCYERNDCKPKFTEGKCCPDYDNCPPIDLRSTSTQRPSTTTVRSAIEVLDETTSGTVKSAPTMNGNPLGISIKEITKPEEIRLTDLKPKQLYPKQKPFEIGVSNHPQHFPSHKIAVVEQSVESERASEQSAEQSVEQFSPSTQTIETSSLNVEETHESEDGYSSNTTEIMINKLEADSDMTSNDDNNSTKIVRHTENFDADDVIGNNITMPEDEGYNSTVSDITSSEEASGQSPDQVYFIHENGKCKPITVFGVEGLQRGDLFEDNVEYEDRLKMGVRSQSEKIDDKLKQFEISPADGTQEIIYENTGNGTTSSGNLNNVKAVSDFDPIGSSSDDFIRVLVTTKHYDNSISTEGPFDDNNVTSSVESASEKIYETRYYTPGPEEASFENSNNSSNEFFDTIYHAADYFEKSNSSTEGSSIDESLTQQSTSPSSVHSLDDDETIPKELNPAYPTIPDEISVYKTYVQQNYNENDDTEGSARGRIPALLTTTEDSTKILSSNPNVTEGPLDINISEEWLKDNISSSITTEGFSGDNNISSVNIQERSPGEPFLIPEWERNSTEFVQNITNDNSSETGETYQRISIDADEFSGSGQGSVKDPITPPISSLSVADNHYVDDAGSPAIELSSPSNSASYKQNGNRVHHDLNEDAESNDGNDSQSSTTLVNSNGLYNIIETFRTAHRNFFKSIF